MHTWQLCCAGLLSWQLNIATIRIGSQAVLSWGLSTRRKWTTAALRFAGEERAAGGLAAAQPRAGAGHQRGKGQESWRKRGDADVGAAGVWRGPAHEEVAPDHPQPGI